MLTNKIGALVEPLSDRRWTAAETRARVAARIGDYTRHGFRRGDRVFIHFGNRNEFFSELLAVWYLGGCAFPIDARFTPFEVQALAEWARPRFSAWFDEPATRLRSDLSTLGVSHVSADLRNPTREVPESIVANFGLEDDALVLFTSGTTGSPKGVVHTHRSLQSRWISLRDHLRLEPFERTLCLLPTHFGHGLICNSLFPWLSGCDLYVMPPFRPELIARLGSVIDDHRISFLSSVPAVWRLARRLATPPSSGSLRSVFVGSAPLSAALWNQVREWCGTSHVCNSYGITETGSWLAGMKQTDFTPEDGLIGEAWGGVIRVLNSKDTNAPWSADTDCPTGESGHVWVKTSALMKGYLDRDDLTEQVVTGGWFLTGDIGFQDDRGWLHLRGREREEINKGGMKVYPADIDAVAEQFVGVADVCTFAYPDELLGEDIGLALVAASNKQSALIGLFEWMTERLAAHQLPRRWYVVPEIPRTSRGKVNRESVSKQCTNMTPINSSALRRKS